MFFARAAVIALAVVVALPAQAQSFQGLDLTPRKKAKPTTLAIKLGSDVKGAKLFVDGKEVGELPREAPETVTAGEHTVRVERLGFKAWEQKVVVAKGPNEVTVMLEAEGGIFSIDANEAGAVCAVDGAADEPLPLTKVLAPGKHQLRISKVGFAPEVKSVEAIAGAEVVVNAELRALSDRPGKASLEPDHDVDLETERGPVTQVSKGGEPIYTKWYLWAGVAVAVAAGVAVAVAVSSKPPAPLDPNTICQGPCDGQIGNPTGFRPLTR